MYFDGAFSRHGAGAGAVLISPAHDKLYYAMQLCFQQGEKVSNNIAEYEALVLGLQKAISLNMVVLKVVGDSEIVVRQVCNTIHYFSLHLKSY